jgi:tryptophanyl-tRNA synthetase
MTQFRDKGGTVLTKNTAIDLSNKLAIDLAKLGLDAEDYKKVFARMKTSTYEYARNTSEATVGLFNYPVLMAADILLYGATYVPVGDDQTQHLEFTRDIAERMNNKFGELFVVPKPVKEQHAFFGKDQGLRIKDLADPTKKMSKSDDTGKGVIFLGDSPEAAAKKIMSATTDSEGVIRFDPEKQPGIANLIQIQALAEGKDLSSVAASYEGQTSYGALKTAVAQSVSQMLDNFQARLAEVDEAAFLAKLERDEAQMNEVASATLLKAQKAVGLR